MKVKERFSSVAVFGGSGYIGSRLLAEFSKSGSGTVGVGRNATDGLLSMDLARPDIASLDLKKRGVTHAIIAAAVSRIDVCESDPYSARVVNVDGTVELAKQLCNKGIKLIVFSSDYVFDGAKGSYTEGSVVSPVNEYGRQKADMEKLLLRDCGENVLVLRLSKVFDVNKGSATLLDEMAGRFVRGEAVSAARDQYFCPVWIDDVVALVGRLMTSGANGVMHLCAPRKTSRLELALNIAEAVGADECLVKNIRLRDLGENFVRPLDTSMVCDRLNRYMKYDFRDVRDCVRELAFNYRGNVRAKKI